MAPQQQPVTAWRNEAQRRRGQNTADVIAWAFDDDASSS
jgi:hypothetical protein